MKRFEVTHEDRETVTKFWAVMATGNPVATCPEMSSMMADGSLDDFPMLQLAAYIRIRNTK
jgi:hypothetical protein